MTDQNNINNTDDPQAIEDKVKDQIKKSNKLSEMFENVTNE